MQFKQVEAFRAIILTGSMTAAARELHTSQPNISRLIAQLERHTGFALFTRVAGRLAPTPEARAFFRDVERAFVGLQDIKASANNIRKQGTGHLRIAAVPSIALTIMPNVLKAFARKFPKTRVSLYVGDSGTVAQWVASSYCDVGISAYVDEMPGMNSERFDTLQGVCVVYKDHPLARVKRPVKIKDFRGESFISLHSGDGTRRNIDALFSAYEEDYRTMYYECRYAVAICNMVGLGMGISIVNPLVAENCLHMGIVVKPLEPRVAFSYFILSSTVHVTSTLALEIHSILREELQKHK